MKKQLDKSKLCKPRRIFLFKDKHYKLSNSEKNLIITGEKDDKSVK